MATDALLTLHRLRCIREDDGSGHSEPYIWPVLIWIDDDTLATPQLVGVTEPALGNARVVIKNDMRAGQVADIPASVGNLRVRMDDNQNVRRLVLAVALFENDETPEKAMKAGYQAVHTEMGAAIADNLLALNGAQTDDERKPIIDEIKRRVRAKVESAIRGALSSWEKVQIALGSLNLDDVVSNDFKSFAALANETFTLSFASSETPPKNLYRIEGELRAVPVTVDRCTVQVNAVQEAQAAVNSIQAEIQSLQAQLHGQTNGEPPLPKSFIVAEIARIRREELPPAVAALDAARKALAACRDRPGARPPVSGGVLVNA
jgi:hypothetical protein